MSASAPPPRVPTPTSSYHGDDDDDGAAYKMDSFGTMPLERPSRDHSLRPPSETSSSTLTLTTVEEAPPEQAPAVTRINSITLDDESVQSLPLVSPDGKNEGSFSRHQQQMQNSNVSLDINVEARTDEPVSRHDVYYASTDTFPTTNVFASQQEGEMNRRDILGAHKMSLDTVPVSNITGDSDSRLTAVMSVGETTTSDLTTTTGGTFDTTNAVVPGAYEINVVEDDDDADNNDDSNRQQATRNRILEEAYNDDEDDSGVLMHSSADEHDDIPLEELFANAQLNSRQNTTNGNPQDENHHGMAENDNPSIMVEMDTAPASSKHAKSSHEHALDLENPPMQAKKSVSKGISSAANSSPPPGNSVGKTAESNETDPADSVADDASNSKRATETKDTPVKEIDEAKGIAAAPAIASAATGTSPHDPEPLKAQSSTSSRSRPYKLYCFRATVMSLVLLVVIVSASLFYTRGNDEIVSGPSSAPMTLAPTLETATPAPSTAIPDTPTAPPVSLQPEIPATASPTLSPSAGTEFEETATFQGLDDGDRFGTDVSISSNGDFVAVLSLDSDEPVRTFQLRGSGWLPFPSVPLTREQALNASVSSLEASVSVEAAASIEGFPVVAVSFASGCQVYEHRGTRWVERGQFLRWESFDSFQEQTIASSTVIQLSSDAAQLAAGYVHRNGRSLVVENFFFDANAEQWFPRGEPIRRERTNDETPLISLSLALSGNGRVVAVGDWTIGNPQATIERFEWNGLDWSLMGQSLELSWGPVSVALSQSGYTFAQVNVALGSTFEWDGEQWSSLGNGFIGGSALSISGDGSSVVVGDAVQGSATILEYVGDLWKTKSVLTGTRTSRFGETVSMSRDGTALSIGSPLENGDGTDVGQVTIFQ